MPHDERSNAALPWLRVEGNRITDPGGRPVVLRGVSLVDLGATEAWYGGVQAMIDRLTDRNDTDGGVAGWYPMVLRLPIYPADSTDFASPNTYREGSDAFYDQVLRPTIDYCSQKGLYVIVDWHYIGNTHEHRPTTEAFWRYMSAKLAGDSHVLFELYNEPVNDGDWDSVRPDMQAWYDIVRLRAPRNLVLVGTPNWCSLAGATADRPLDGANLAYVSHMYPLHWNQPALREQITRAATRHAVFHTEWGFQAGVPGANGAVVSGTVASFGLPFRDFLERQGISWTAWCASHDWCSAIFHPDWTLRTGEGGMGAFLKRWLYEKRGREVPAPLAVGTRENDQGADGADQKHMGSMSEPKWMVCNVGDHHVTVRYRGGDCLPILASLGGRQDKERGQWVFECAGDLQVASLLGALRDAGVPFQGGPSGWPPAEIFLLLRKRGLLEGGFLEAVFGGPERGWALRER